MSAWQKWVPAVIAVVISMIVLIPMISDPRFETLHPVDFMKMVGAGACVGAALTTLVVWLRA